MKLLVIGAGGREHALAWKLAAAPRVQKVFVAPGNGGTAREPGVENVPITDLGALADFAAREQVQLTVVGPEAPLAAGVVDLFRSRGLRIFGPTRAAAQLESSKEFAKRFLVRHGIPTGTALRLPRGLRADGTRRPLRVLPRALELSPSAEGNGLRLGCALPPGAYVTVLVESLVGAFADSARDPASRDAELDRGVCSPDHFPPRRSP